jgi:hypothetical protein
MKALTKQELFRQMKRFVKDRERGISIDLFCRLAGISTVQFYEVFVHRTYPQTEMMQLRVSKAYQQWKEGNVKVMRRKDNTRFVEYRQESQPAMMPGMGLKVTPDGIKIKVGMVNRHDYSEIDLKEALRG